MKVIKAPLHLLADDPSDLKGTVEVVFLGRLDQAEAVDIANVALAL